MNKAIFLAIGWVLLLALLSSCAGKEVIKKEDMPGGLRDRSWDAPKTIQSKEILRFECEFSFNERQEEGYFYFIAGMEAGDQTALCRMIGYEGFTETLALEFEAPLDALKELQALADQHDLPRYNGIDRHTNGLPYHYGSRLLIDYTSGERVYAYDNSSGFMDYRAVNAIHDFFRDLARQSGDLVSP
ncbi:MAG: hypothetical protein GX838_00560 [Clostridiaceae bacterium]|nr:hypothetical protein [Clostridiaceae bacterium]